MSVYRTKGEKFYRFDFQSAGIRYAAVTDCTRRKDAERYEEAFKKKVVAEAKARRANAGVPNVADAFRQYFHEVGQYHGNPETTKRNLNSIESRIGSTTLLHIITDKEVADLVAWRRALPKKNGELPAPATVNRHTETLRKVMIRARDKWKIQFDDMPDWGEHLLDENNERTRELTPEEEARLLDQIREDYRPIFLYSKMTGVRKMNAVSLKKSALNFEMRLVTFTQKGGKIHRVPMTEDVYWLLMEECEKTNTEFVFTYVAQKTAQGKDRGQRYPITSSGLRRIWNKALTSAEIEDYRWHDNRHTAGTRIARKGGLHVAKKLLGHSKIETTMRYVHATQDDVMEAMKNAEQHAKEARQAAQRDRIKAIGGKK